MEGRLYQLILLVQRYADFALIYQKNGGSVRFQLERRRATYVFARKADNDIRTDTLVRPYDKMIGVATVFR
ncbi:hypothetical protein ACU6T4_10390 [Avibacterium paragallinarum]|uniref:hypothetical protein n=1 Tax=Avibacterium paragallinarum TaxID=728 RepID=UPI00021AD260|nr:hypothetical protein [Avibacterium paragallinarum]AZI13721.1 hypothetical protein EIA51_03155 [Avibacterium paragallinarum]QIR11963.1 hypothetical protein HBL79_06785 [Avibacterium paragallinarum]QJE09217.1 hypothetical protein HHJ62_02255 [Avibacterium paragallinarum]QJE11413.1 hypothetical protein HHJ61_02255 [Avibacterium paragallinarum]QJE13612.1 hypothetical protein HHJ60_02265 [Avibacterium paragallinarum]